MTANSRTLSAQRNLIEVRQWFFGLQYRCSERTKGKELRIVSDHCSHSVGWVTSNVISHSASANLLVPMGMGLASTVSTGAAEIAMVIALGCSLGMCLPISTPPNAIAYSTGTTPTKEMAIVGIIVGVVGIILLSFVAPLTWGAIGVM